MDELTQLEKDLIRHESLRTEAYWDEVGKVWTIGYGHTRGVKSGDTITKEQALKLLKSDVSIAEKDASEFVSNYKSLSPERKNVLINMAFNLGAKKLAKFKDTRRAIEAEDWNAASNEMMDSKWAGQVKGRAKELSEIMRGNILRRKPDMKTKPTGDAFSNVNTQGYIKNAKFSETAIQEKYMRYVARGMKLIHHPSMRDNVLNALSSGEPIESTAKTLFAIINKVDDAARKSNEEIPDEIKAIAAADLLGQLAELGQVTGKFNLDKDKQEAALASAVNKYMSSEINAGRIDRRALAEAAGKNVFDMSPEQRQQVDESMKRIYATASESKQRYSAGLSNPVPMPDVLKGGA